MDSVKRRWLGLLGAGFFGAALTLTLGADNLRPPVYPRYSVYNHGPFVHITDNTANKQYIYINNPDQPSKLLGYIDLDQTGQPELKATKVDSKK